MNNAGITGSGRVSPMEAVEQIPSSVDRGAARVSAGVRVVLAVETALNAVTVQNANELRKDGILVNAVTPGYVDTELNDHNGFMTVAQGAAPIVRLATIDDDGPSGGFFSEAGSVPW